MDLASRSSTVAVQEVLVDLLNEANTEVQEAHDSIRGQELLAGYNPLPGENALEDPLDTEYDENGRKLAQTVRDDFNVEITGKFETSKQGNVKITRKSAVGLVGRRAPKASSDRRTAQ